MGGIYNFVLKVPGQSAKMPPSEYLILELPNIYIYLDIKSVSCIFRYIIYFNVFKFKFAFATAKYGLNI
jgi:hypothetical protein